MYAHIRIWLLSLLTVWALSHASVYGDPVDTPARDLSPVEKVRKALDQTMLLDYTGNSFHDVIQHLKDKTKLNFVTDQIALGQIGIAIEDIPGQAGPVLQFHLKGDKNTKVRSALQRMLNGYNLTYVILEDSVLITTEELGLHRQMRQRVSVDVNNEALSKVLKDLARRTALNLIIDPRVKESDSKVSLQLEDATLETTVRLLAEMGGLKSVRMGNVLFITSEARAEKLRKEDMEPTHRNISPDRYSGPTAAGAMIGGFGGGIGVPPAVAPPVQPERAVRPEPPPAPDTAPPVPEGPNVQRRRQVEPEPLPPEKN
jgi:hypothetical protein